MPEEKKTGRPRKGGVKFSQVVFYIDPRILAEVDAAVDRRQLLELRPFNRSDAIRAGLALWLAQEEGGRHEPE